MNKRKTKQNKTAYISSYIHTNVRVFPRHSIRVQSVHPMSAYTKFCTFIGSIVWSSELLLATQRDAPLAYSRVMMGSIMTEPREYTWSTCKWWHAPTIRCRYNAVNFHPNPHKRRLIARPWGRGMGCLLWVPHMIKLCVSRCSAVCNTMFYQTAVQRHSVVFLLTDKKYEELFSKSNSG